MSCTITEVIPRICMSTRKGTVKFLDDILRDVGDKMHEVMKKNEVKYSQVAEMNMQISKRIDRSSRKEHYAYRFPVMSCTITEVDAMTSFEGDTGPYLQYAHARLCSMARKSELDVKIAEDSDGLKSLSSLQEYVGPLGQQADQVDSMLLKPGCHDILRG
jgi:arginyl-tRNA synthetase